MKTSNILFISFLIFLFGGITFVCIGSKYYVEEILSVSAKKTAPFSVVVAESGAYLVLKNGREFSVSQSYKKDVVPDFAPFEVRNDTLYVAAVKSRKDGEWFIVPQIYCKNVKSIIAKENSNINLDNYQVDSLLVNLDKSYFHWDYNKPAYLNIVSKNSHLNLNGDNIEKINLQFDKTTLYMNSKKATKEISGSLINDSEFQGNIDGKVSIEADESSRIYIR
jgi:hypothetical protein